jgi:F-type H+-transporting ATPase subunit delta
MSSLILQIRYAQSIFDLAKNLNLIEDVHNDMLLIVKVCEENHLLRAILKNPTIKPLKKRALLQEIFTKNVSDATMQFLNLLSAKRRDVYLMEIALQFIELYKKAKGIKTAYLTTSETLNNEIRKQLIVLLKEELQSEIELVEKVSSNLIGGFSLKVEDNLYDASIFKSISILKQTFAKNIYAGSF